MIFLGRRDHLFHPFLDFVDLRMHFFDEVVFNLRQSLNAFALLTELFQKLILFG